MFLFYLSLNSTSFGSPFLTTHLTVVNILLYSVRYHPFFNSCSEVFPIRNGLLVYLFAFSFIDYHPY